MRSIRTSALAAGLLALTATAGQAQSANINATATVLTAITVTGANPLAFGNVFPGVAKTVAITDAGAGRFDLTGQTSANVNIAFTLPANLTSGGNNLPIGIVDRVSERNRHHHRWYRVHSRSPATRLQPSVARAHSSSSSAAP